MRRDAAGVLAGGDAFRGEAAAQAAENVEIHVSELRHAIFSGRDTARWAPLRRRARIELESYARIVDHADLAARSARVLVQ